MPVLLTTLQHTYVASDVDAAMKILENDSIQLFKWFSDNQMKTNKGNWHLIVNNNEHVSIKIYHIEVESSDCEKLLEIKIDSKLKRCSRSVYNDNISSFEDL